MSAHINAAMETDGPCEYQESECAELLEELESSAAYLSAYYYELECLLAQIETADTHYKILGLDYLSTTGDIVTAYLKAMITLDPATYGLDLELPEALEPRVARASERVLEAFQTLINFDERLQYDGRLFGWETESSAQNQARQRHTKPKPSGPRHKQNNLNRRANERFQLNIPVAISGYDEAGSDWHEVVQSVDLSRSGGCVLLGRRVPVGSILYLRMPMPTILRNHEYLDETYGTYAIVRWISPPRDGFRLAGLQFLGELPPPGFRQRPWAIFNLGSWDGVDRRSEERESVSEAVEIEYFDESEQLIKKDSGFIEDISTAGARVSAEQPPLEADLIRIIRPKVSMSVFALVRNRFRGRDGYERLCAQFISGFPDSLKTI